MQNLILKSMKSFCLIRYKYTKNSKLIIEVRTLLFVIILSTHLLSELGSFLQQFSSICPF